MKTILFTGFDEPYDKLASITTPRMSRWAKRQSVNFRMYVEPPYGFNIYWTGLVRAVELFREGYDRVIYLDVDQLITNFDHIPTVVWDGGLYVSRDWGRDATEPWHFSACGWIAHRDCMAMMHGVIAMEPEWRDRPFQEQGPWREYVKRMLESAILRESTDPMRALINVLGQHEFNAVPEEVCPGKVVCPWKRGDFAAHLTMLPVDERVDLAHEIIKQAS